MRRSKESKKIDIIKTALRLFSKRGFYTTTIPEIAKAMSMSAGNFYNYFSSKEKLAEEIIRYISEYLATKIRTINESPHLSTKEKIREIVHIYFQIAIEEPEMLDFFLRIYLSNREIYKERCQGITCIMAFVTELMIFFDDGVQKGDLRNQNFFSAFGLFMGYLGGMVFLNGEAILPEPLESYEESITENIYRALKNDDQA
ncbi:MAG: TetR/AcrR family transcriptional regulator [Hydrogenimonas sp.]|nr:MAG: TetR/AcrR family transcriptional regulator [Hydrogenimonas sp.]